MLPTDMCNAAWFIRWQNRVGRVYQLFGPCRVCNPCLMPNGTIDNTTAAAGWVFRFLWWHRCLSGIIAESDDDLVLAGYADNRSTPAGSIIPWAWQNYPQQNPWSDSELAASDLLSGSSSLGCNSLALQADGKLVFAGYHYTGAHSAYWPLVDVLVPDAHGIGLPQNDLQWFTIFPNPVNSNMVKCAINIRHWKWN